MFIIFPDKNYTALKAIEVTIFALFFPIVSVILYPIKINIYLVILLYVILCS